MTSSRPFCRASCHRCSSDRSRGRVKTLNCLRCARSQSANPFVQALVAQQRQLAGYRRADEVRCRCLDDGRVALHSSSYHASRSRRFRICPVCQQRDVEETLPAHIRLRPEGYDMHPPPQRQSYISRQRASRDPHNHAIGHIAGRNRMTLTAKSRYPALTWPVAFLVQSSAVLPAFRMIMSNRTRPRSAPRRRML